MRDARSSQKQTAATSILESHHVRVTMLLEARPVDLASVRQLPEEREAVI